MFLDTSFPILISTNGNKNNKPIIDWDAKPGGKVKDYALEGYIGLQNHDSVSPPYFRNIYIKEL
jgi:hypothetical protein